MDTNSISQNLSSLIQETKKSAQELSQAQSDIRFVQQQALSFRNQANQLINQANSVEDESQAGSLRSMASSYYYRAEQCEDRAEQGRQIEKSIKGNLRSQIGKYQSIITECQTNIAALGQALSKLQSVSGTKYGGSAASKALQTTQDRLNSTRSLAQKSSQGIQYISELLGEAYSAGTTDS